MIDRATKINCTKRLIRRCLPLQRVKGLRDTVMSRLLEVADLCSRTLSDPANRLRKTRKKKSSAVPLFRSGHMSAICARLSMGKVGVQRGRKTAGCPSFLPPRRAPHSPALRRAQFPAESQRKTPAREGRTRRRQFAHPAESVQKRSRPVRANTLAQFVYPGQPVPKSPADASCTGI